MRLRAILLTALACALSPAPAAAEPTIATLPGGARWAAEVPPEWNGTLLLWSRGYSPKLGAPEVAPPGLREALLGQGYALAASDYGAAGWALEEAVPAQIATLSAFAARYGKPKRTIAWGYSMGGLVTTALAEQAPASIDGAAAFCASLGGAVGMLNMALDGAYAFRTLVAPQSDIRIVGIDDDMANGQRVAGAVAEAVKTPQGRARLALAAVLAGLPGWTEPETSAPAADDYQAQARQMASAIVRGVFLPRVDQERRAGGIFSWNRGIDYRAQLALSGRGTMIEALYREAGLDLAADLATLNRGATIRADPKAVDYMTRHYGPNARPTVPLVAIQAVGDGLTSPSMQRAYTEAAGNGAKSLWVAQAGHCPFKPATALAGLHYLEARLARGAWAAKAAGFVDNMPPRMLRPCFRGRRCR
ncbi:MAG: alpha/beta hydrolase [Alphaproteobacteria bacterium]|nr:alpha/beta hydrolase [Alphaproteobacteria bacterium]